MVANMAVAIGRLSQLGIYFRQSKGSGPSGSRVLDLYFCGQLVLVSRSYKIAYL